MSRPWRLWWEKKPSPLTTCSTWSSCRSLRRISLLRVRVSFRCWKTLRLCFMLSLHKWILLLNLTVNTSTSGLSCPVCSCSNLKVCLYFYKEKVSTIYLIKPERGGVKMSPVYSYFWDKNTPSFLLYFKKYHFRYSNIFLVGFINIIFFTDSSSAECELHSYKISKPHNCKSHFIRLNKLLKLSCYLFICNRAFYSPSKLSHSK